jgi:ABC-type lipoprotein export system ATPase subunit
VTDDFPLACAALDKTFRLGKSELPILRGIDIAFPGRGLNTIQGASGSGKSTLLQILGGLEAPDRGEVRWRGDSVYAWSRARLAAWRNLTVGFVFQAYHLFPELTALENVDFPARLARRGDAKLSAHRRNFPAASSSASPSPARCATVRPSSSPTNRPAISTTPRAPASSTCSCACTRSAETA